MVIISGRKSVAIVTKFVWAAKVCFLEIEDTHTYRNYLIATNLSIDYSHFIGLSKKKTTMYIWYSTSFWRPPNEITIIVVWLLMATCLLPTIFMLSEASEERLIYATKSHQMCV